MVFRTSEYLLSHYPDQRLIKWWYFQKEPNEWCFQVPSLGLLDITFRIIDDGSIPLTYHPDGEKNAIDDSEPHWNLYDHACIFV